MNTTDTYRIGDDESMAKALEVAQQSTATLDLIDKTVGGRTSQWEQAIEAELQDLITQASELRKLISTAKTQTKKTYYNKKFAKVNVQVRQMLVALQRVKIQQQMTQQAQVSNDAPAVAPTSE